MSTHFKTIGEVAREFDIDTSRLRDWCKRGLVEAELKSNTRYIPVSEFEKIARIKEFFEEAKRNGTRKTFEDLKEELFKEELLDNHKEDEQITKVKQSVASTLEDELLPSFIHVGEQFTVMNKMMENQMKNFESKLSGVDSKLEAKVDLVLSALASFQEKQLQAFDSKLESNFNSVLTELAVTKEKLQDNEKTLEKVIDLLEREREEKEKLQKENLEFRKLIESKLDEISSSNNENEKKSWLSKLFG